MGVSTAHVRTFVFADGVPNSPLPASISNTPPKQRLETITSYHFAASGMWSHSRQKCIQGVPRISQRRSGCGVGVDRLSSRLSSTEIKTVSPPHWLNMTQHNGPRQLSPRHGEG
jgi:hypothetical protein